MSRKRALFLFSVGAFLLALSVSQLAWGKAHVRLGKIQVCLKGRTIITDPSFLQTALELGACRLPACDFANIFQEGDSCPDDVDPADGFCDVPNPVSAVGVTPACTDPY